MGDLLSYLILGGLMGMLGQGARAVIGLKGMSTDARTLNLNPNDVFEAGRLITSIIIGFLVGLAAALVTLKSGDTTLAIPGWTTLLGWVASGYAGTDFLEGFIAQYLPQGAPGSTAQKLTAAAVKPAAAPPPTPTPLSIVQNACQMAFGIPGSSVTPDQDLSKNLGLSGTDYTKLEGFINAELRGIRGAKKLDDNARNRWQAQGATVQTVLDDVTAALPH